MLLKHHFYNKEEKIDKDFSLFFDKENNAEYWKITNDSVMGGLSIGNSLIENQSLIFSGNISPENSGGFTSIFKKLPILHESVNTVTIVVKGDGKSYQLRVRTLVMGYELAYKINIETSKGVVQTHTFPLADFEGSFRGRVVSNVQTLKAETISHVGFILSLTQASLKAVMGFSLTVYSIKFHHK